MTKRTKEILDKLDEVYTREYKCYLNHENPGQLLIATMLSAQCTDVRVNIVTKDLFVKYPDMQAFAKADLKELEQDIKPTGFIIIRQILSAVLRGFVRCIAVKFQGRA